MIILQFVLRQAVALASKLKDKIQKTKIIAVIAYVYFEKVRPKLIAKTMDFKVIIGIIKIGVVAEELES